MAKTINFLDNRYQVYVLPQAKEKMELYCDLSDGEIGWLAYVEDMGINGFLITDCILLKQEVHSTTTEIDPMALIDFWNETKPEDQCKIKMWGHSHVNMSPTPSGQDDSQMEYFRDGNPWFIRLITNKKREYNIDIYDYANGVKVHMDQTDLQIYNPFASDLRKQIEEEIKAKVSKKTYTTTSPASTSKWNNNYSYNKNLKALPKKSDVEPLLKDIEVKYVASFDEIMKDPDYWQPAV